MIKVDCAICLKELDEPGALIFGPPYFPLDGNVINPDTLLTSTKQHLCVSCWGRLCHLTGGIKKNGWASQGPGYAFNEGK